MLVSCFELLGPIRQDAREGAVELLELAERTKSPARTLDSTVQQGQPGVVLLNLSPVAPFFSEEVDPGECLFELNPAQKVLELDVDRSVDSATILLGHDENPLGIEDAA